MAIMRTGGRAGRKPAAKAKSGAKAAPKAAAKRESFVDRALVELPAGGTYASIGAYFAAGLDEKARREWARTRDEAGRLRGGSVGCAVSDQEYIGTCLRAAAARFLGAEPPRESAKWRPKQIMFGGGIQSEVDFAESLALGLPGGLEIQRDYPLEMKVDGERWTGREDIAICFDGKAECLIELKNKASLPLDLAIKEEPSLEHLLQLGKYMDVAQLPGQIWYTSRSSYPLPTQWKWVSELLPEQPGENPYIKFSKPMYGRPGLPTGVEPFYMGFHVRWHEGRLYYSRADDLNPDHAPSVWAVTPITKTGIDRYYENVLHTVRGDELPPKPSPLDVNGKRKTFDPCEYCDWNNTCKAVGDNWTSWREAVQSQVAPDELTQGGGVPPKTETKK